MAISNVRFYKLNVLPNFEAKHKGIFVHVTETMHKDKWTLTLPDGKIEKDPATIYMTPGKDGGNVGRINLVEWLSNRHIVEIASGLWFGGENGWELLSNETTDAAINAAIDDKIATLHVDGYAQATISGSTLTISGIKENNGIIAKDDTNKLDIAIDGTYNESTNKIATQSTVTNAINGLNTTETIQAVTKTTSGNITTLTLKGVKEENGVIAQGDGTDSFIVSDAKLNIQIGSADAFEVFSANKQSDSTIKLDGLVFKKDGDVISVITKTPVSSTNPLVTKDDINGLAGAMHYKGGVTSSPTANENTKQGDVWIVTTAFGEYEVGDMFIARADGASATFDTVQGNLTLGTGIGKVAANSAALSNNKLVVASATGIETIDFDKDNLISDDRNKRDLSIANGTADTLVASLYHDVTISDAFQVIGKDFTKTINISSTNRSIEIAANSNTGVVVDLVWNTSIE